MSRKLANLASVADTILADAQERAAGVEQLTGRKGCLATVLVGDDAASHTYVRMKMNRCRTAGLESRSHHLAASATTGDVVALVKDLSADDSIDGILVQHPMPAQIDEHAVFEAITPSKDVGVTMESFAAMCFGRARISALHPSGNHSSSRGLRRRSHRFARGRYQTHHTRTRRSRSRTHNHRRLLHQTVRAALQAAKTTRDRPS